MLHLGAADKSACESYEFETKGNILKNLNFVASEMKHSDFVSNFEDKIQPPFFGKLNL